jgi:hypothetical protein
MCLEKNKIELKNIPKNRDKLEIMDILSKSRSQDSNESNPSTSSSIENRGSKKSFSKSDGKNYVHGYDTDEEESHKYKSNKHDNKEDYEDDDEESESEDHTEESEESSEDDEDDEDDD